MDVFTDTAYSGNGLIVVFCDDLDHPREHLRLVTAEMRQFETIFVAPGERGRVRARIFTVDEELPFAGHPVIGAAAALHERLSPSHDNADWQLHIGQRVVSVASRRDHGYYSATMDQGKPVTSAPLPEALKQQAAGALNLDQAQLLALPLQVVSTGLPYLIVPVTPSGLTEARIVTADFEPWLATLGAKFVYVLDPDAQEGRTWDNHGTTEDVATGSAAGPVAAYLHANQLCDHTAPVQLRQGRFVGRPSTITITPDAVGRLWVGGPVRPVASGTLDALPTSPERMSGTSQNPRSS